MQRASDDEVALAVGKPRAAGRDAHFSPSASAAARFAGSFCCTAFAAAGFLAVNTEKPRLSGACHKEESV